MNKSSTVVELPLGARAPVLHEQVSIRHLLASRAARSPDAVALAAPGRAPLTYYRLFEHIEYVVGTLRGIGVGRGKRIALVLPQGSEIAVASLALTATSTCVPMNAAYRAAEYESYFKQFKISALIVQAGLQCEAGAVAGRQGIPILELKPCYQGEAGLFVLSCPDGSYLADRHCEPQSEDVALILGTSGTTSRPKVVPLRHTNLCTSAISMGQSLGLSEKDRCLIMMPLIHIHGFMVTLASLAAGGSVVCAQTSDRGEFFRLLEAFSPTWYSAVPTIHLSILSRASRYIEIIRQRPLRFIRSSSSALAPKTAEDLEAVFTAPVIEAYGMTEAAHQIATNPLPPAARKFGSVGLAAGPEVAIMDERGDQLASGQRGEIVLRGPSVISGYMGDARVNDTVFTKGWFRTGDEGFIDNEGYIFITGRFKEMINRGGQKIAPREIDETLMTHPAVAQAVTFSMPHSTLGEQVGAAIILREDMTATEVELREFARQRLTDHKVPQRIVLVNEIPLGVTGKLQRSGLADRLGADLGNRIMSGAKQAQDQLETALIRIWEEVLGVSPIGIVDDFFDLGGHSLLAVEMIDQVEQACGCRVPLATLFDGATVEHLATVLRQQTTSSDSRPRLLELQTRGSRPPFFLLHGDWGYGGFYCRKIAPFLGEDQPFYALPPHGTDGELAPQSIEAMAADHLETVRAKYPSGPYLLGGHCNGALIAWEMARQLRAAGQPVHLLVLLEPPPPRNIQLDLRCLHRGVAVLNRLGRLNPDESMSRFLQLKSRWSRLAAVIFGDSGVKTTAGFQGNLPTAIPRNPRTLDRWSVLDAHYERAMEGYRPCRYRGRVEIIWARDNYDYLARQHVDPILPWRRLASESALYLVPGSHLTMLTAHVRELAECLRNCLEHAEPRRE